MRLEVRYARSFLLDLKSLEPAAYQRVYEFLFVEFVQSPDLYHLPELRQVGTASIFYRFTLDNYIIGLEVTGHIIKFLRVLPRPDV